MASVGNMFQQESASLAINAVTYTQCPVRATCLYFFESLFSDIHTCSHSTFHGRPGICYSPLGSGERGVIVAQSTD